MAVKYRLDFDSIPGAEATAISWRMDILQDGYVGAPLPVIGGSSPVTIEYTQDNDIYKPIVGSSAKITLVVTDDVTYDDFNTGGLREYEVRIQYLEGGTYHNYWVGFINPIDSSEAVTTPPFEVEFTATDYLGLLEQLSINRDEVEADGGKLFGYVHRALLQTGTELPIYIDSGIQVAAGDSILNVSSTTSAFYDEDEEVEGTVKDSLTGVLETFNCSIRQSYARWYIFNCSTHGGTGATENKTWKVFNHLGVAQPDATEDLRLVVSSDGPLLPANRDLRKHSRRPAGSVEARPSDLTQVEFIPNHNFNSSATGWDATGSLDTTLNFTNQLSLPSGISSDDFVTGGNSIFTTRSRQTIDNADEIWFRNTVGFPIELTLPSVLNIEWKYTDGPSGGSYKSVRFLYRLRLDLPSGIDYSNVRLNLSTGISQTMNTGVTTLWYDDVSRRWTDGNNLFGVDTRWNRANANSTDEWQITELKLPSALQAADWVNNPSDIPTGSTLTIEVAYPQAQTTGFFEFGSREANSTTLFNTIIDRIELSSDIPDDVQNPVYERVQPNFTQTITYNPKFISQGLSSFREVLSSTEYWRNGEASTDARLLENIITQQKLNDFRDNFEYYEGSLINLTSVPFGQHHKPKVEFAGFVEPVSCIMNGGSYDLKMNQYNVNMYLPNQATDQSPGDFDGTEGFSTQNVDLRIPEYIPDNPNQDPLVFDYNFTLTDNLGNPAPAGVTITPSSAFELFEAPVGTILTRRLEFMPSAGQALVPGSFTVTSTHEFIQFGDFYSSSEGNVSVDVSITSPNTTTFETIEISAQYIDFVPEATPGVVVATVVVNNTGSNLSSAAETYDVTGVPGSVVHFTHHIRPVDNNWQVFAGNFDATYTSVNLSNADAADGINSVAIDFAYTIPATTESVTVTVAGNATAAGTVGVDIFTRTVNFGTAPANTTFHENENIFTGVPGSTHDYFITLIPNADYFISSVAAPTLPAGIVANGAPYQSGENWEIPIQVTIGPANDALNITQNAITVAEEPYSITFNTNNVGIQNAVVTPATQRITFDSGDFGNSITPFTISVTPTGVFQFDSVNDILIDINEAQVQTPEGVVVLSEDQFTAAIQPTLNAGAIEIIISGNFPNTGSNYVLDINIVGNSATGFGASTVKPATTAAIRSLTPGIASLGGAASFEVITNGTWNASVSAAGDSDGVNSDDGQFSLTSGSGLLSLSGGYSPTAGIEGTHIIELNVGEEPYYFNPAGPTGVSAAFFTNISHTINIHARNPDGSDGALLGSASVSQGHQFGGRTITLPDGWAGEASFVALTASGNKPTWTFNVPM